MQSATQFVLFSALVATSIAAPFNFGDLDLFPGFVQNTNLNTPAKEGEVVKRRIFEENRDAGLKQVNFQSLIGDLEQSLFQSALSVSSVGLNKDAHVQEVTPAAAAEPSAAFEEHAIIKRHTDATPTTSIETPANKETIESLSTVATEEDAAESRNVILQTTEKVPEQNGVPAHILIDRISVQPHHGGVPLIPTFQVHQTKVVSTTTNDGSSTDGSPDTKTKISITKTSITATKQVEEESTTESSIAAESVTSTTHLSKVQLKEAEEELKEKVAEVEAEPVILTARV